MTIYTVAAGDTLTDIAARFGVSAALIAEVNGIEEQAPLVVGQALLILIPAEVYTVQSGDSIYAIARQYNTSVVQLYRNNPSLQGLPTVSVGQMLSFAMSRHPPSC